MFSGVLREQPSMPMYSPSERNLSATSMGIVETVHDAPEPAAVPREYPVQIVAALAVVQVQG